MTAVAPQYRSQNLGLFPGAKKEFPHSRPITGFTKHTTGCILVPTGCRIWKLGSFCESVYFPFGCYPIYNSKWFPPWMTFGSRKNPLGFPLHARDKPHLGRARSLPTIPVDFLAKHDATKVPPKTLNSSVIFETQPFH